MQREASSAAVFLARVHRLALGFAPLPLSLFWSVSFYGGPECSLRLLRVMYDGRVTMPPCARSCYKLICTAVSRWCSPFHARSLLRRPQPPPHLSPSAARWWDLQHYLAARNLKHALRERETIQDLKDHGLYQARHLFIMVPDYLSIPLSRFSLKVSCRTYEYTVWCGPREKRCLWTSFLACAEEYASCDDFTFVLILLASHIL